MIRLFNLLLLPVFNRRKRLFPALVPVCCMLVACMLSTPLFSQTKRAVEVMHIQPFRLDKAFKFDWRKERPEVKAGLLVVFKVDTSMVKPTNDLEYVLYAGNHTVQRINQGYESGFVIGIIPAQIDLSKEPVWFGTKELPERIDAKMIREQRANALKAGIKPMKAELVKDRTKDMVSATDLTTLLRNYAADLILEFSPQEKYIVEAWRLPETGK